MITEEYARSVVENFDRLDLGDITVGPRQCFETIVALYERLSAQAPVEPHGQEDQDDRTPEPNPNQGSDPS